MKKIKLFITAALTVFVLGGCSSKSDDIQIVSQSSSSVSASSELSTEAPVTEQPQESSSSVIYIDTGSTAEFGSSEEFESQPVVPSDSAEPSSEVIITEAPATVTEPPLTEPEQPETPVPPGNHVIVLDPGHGGSGYGAVYNGVNEKDLSLKVGLYLKQYLESNYSNVSVIMTRTTDVRLSEDQKNDLQGRCDIARDRGAEYLISLHFNSDGMAHNSAGALICASGQADLQERCQTLGDMVLSELSTLGLTSQGVFFRKSDVYFYEDGTPMDYYAINRFCAAYHIPSIIIEHCFIDNPAEIRFVDSDEKLMALAHADGRAIAAYFGLVP